MNTRTKQYLKFYKFLMHDKLAECVFRLSYDYDYTYKLFEYDEKERNADYATQHAHDYASQWNDMDDFYAMSTHDLWKEYKRPQQSWEHIDNIMEV